MNATKPTISHHEYTTLEVWARSIIPAHLNADELIANSWGNAGDAGDLTVAECFRTTVLEYIDQNCSSY